MNENKGPIIGYELIACQILGEFFFSQASTTISDTIR